MATQSTAIKSRPASPSPALARATQNEAQSNAVREVIRATQQPFGRSGPAEWSPRRTLVFAVGASGVLWAAIAGLAYLVLQSAF